MKRFAGLLWVRIDKSNIGKLAALALFLLGTEVALSAENAQSQPSTLTVTPLEDLEPTVVGYDEYYDPFESFNRKMFAFNDGLYRIVLTPLSRGYTDLVPAPVRNRVSGVFDNVREPLNVVNHLLQGRPAEAGRNTGRFLLNTTVGLLGLFDPAQAWFGLEKEQTSFGNTLIRYGVAQGPYLVLPVLGASDFRNTSSVIFQSLLYPPRYFTSDPETSYILVGDNFQRTAPALELYPDLKAEAEDPYLYFRNQYLQGQQRDREEMIDENQ